MSSPVAGGPPLRVIGIGLAALGVALVGVGILAGGSGSSSAANASGASATVTTVAVTSAPATAASSSSSASSSSATATTVPPSTTIAPTTTVAPVTTVPPTTASPLPADSSPSDVTVRVYNNSTIHGLSQQAASELRAKGWNVVETGNFTGLFPTTTVYYRPGTGEQTEAKKLAASIGATSAPRIEEIADFAPGLIVVVTSDYSG